MLPQQPLPRKDPDSEREVFRSPGSVVLSWAWFVVAVIILIDLAVQGRDHAAAVTAGLVVAITGIVYSCAYRPRIVADSDGITIANPVRDHQVPWAAVDKVDVVNSVRVHCAPAPGSAQGKILYSWAVQSSPRATRRAARRDLAGQRPRLTRRPRSLGPPPGAVPRYGEMPDSARDALERSSAEFTAGRLAERAQHARQAAATAPAGDGPSAADRLGAGESLGAGDRLGAGDQPGDGVQPGAAVTDARPARGPAIPAGHAARWAWLPIAAMAVPLVVLIIIALT